MSIWWCSGCSSPFSFRLHKQITCFAGAKNGRMCCMRCVLILIIPQAEFIKHKIFSFCWLFILAFHWKYVDRLNARRNETATETETVIVNEVVLWSFRNVLCFMLFFVFFLFSVWLEFDFEQLNRYSTSPSKRNVSMRAQKHSLWRGRRLTHDGDNNSHHERTRITTDEQTVRWKRYRNHKQQNISVMAEGCAYWLLFMWIEGTNMPW